MSEELTDEQSHYEISLTAGQAFVAFVLLLLSLAASFAFGLMIGKGQGDDRLVVRKEPAVVTEASAMPKRSAGKIVELGVEPADFSAQPDTPVVSTSTAPTVTEGTPAAAPVVDVAANGGAERADALAAHAKAPEPVATAAPVYAQLLSTGDQKTAETLAAKVINAGYPTAYVERGSSDKGMIYRVRVKFDSDAEARTAEPRLREYSKEVWITKQ